MRIDEFYIYIHTHTHKLGVFSQATATTIEYEIRPRHLAKRQTRARISRLIIY